MGIGFHSGNQGYMCTLEVSHPNYKIAKSWSIYPPTLGTLSSITAGPLSLDKKDFGDQNRPWVRGCGYWQLEIRHESIDVHGDMDRKLMGLLYLVTKFIFSSFLVNFPLCLPYPFLLVSPRVPYKLCGPRDGAYDLCSPELSGNFFWISRGNLSLYPDGWGKSLLAQQLLGVLLTFKESEPGDEVPCVEGKVRT